MQISKFSSAFPADYEETNARKAADSNTSNPDPDNKSEKISSFLNVETQSRGFWKIVQILFWGVVCFSVVVSWARFSWLLESEHMENDQSSECQAIVQSADAVKLRQLCWVCDNGNKNYNWSDSLSDEDCEVDLEYLVESLSDIDPIAFVRLDDGVIPWIVVTPALVISFFVPEVYACSDC